MSVETLLCTAIILLVVLPVSSYLVFKMSTYGILKAQWRFKQEHKNTLSWRNEYE
jgi:hypothetical protein